MEGGGLAKSATEKLRLAGMVALFTPPIDLRDRAVREAAVDGAGDDAVRGD